MTPLAVDERYHRQGLARQLAYEGLDSLNEPGYIVMATLGDPVLCSRFGFELVAYHDPRCRQSGIESTFQIYHLMGDVLNGTTGLIEYHEYFDRS